jgi:hypothetical protein
MALNFNINPYWDDFDETKNYHRILFKPGYAVQARELTQLQTELSDQIKKFGKNIFVNGSLVLGGNRLFENTLLSIKLNSSYLGNTVNINNFIGKTIYGSTSGTQAIVKSVADIDTDGNPKTLIVKITSGSAFNAGEIIYTSGIAYYASILGAAAFNPAMSFSIDSGVFFVDGKFIYLEAQSIPVAKYDNTSSHSIGLVLKEEVISTDSPEGDSLFDRAQESPNYAAPGADRYKAYLELTVKGVTGATGVLAGSKNFIEIARVENGVLVFNANKTLYSEIGKELARRTSDESGDYTVKNWPIQITDDIAGASGAFTVSLDPGKAYVKGFEFETISQTFLTLDRAREYEQVNLVSTDTLYGNYVIVKGLKGTFKTNTIDGTSYSTVELHNQTYDTVSGTGTKIGTARVRYLTLDSGTPGIVGASGVTAIYKMYLYDIQITTGKYFRDVESIICRTGSALAGYYGSAVANISNLSKIGGATGPQGDTVAGATGPAYLAGADSPGLVFPLPNQYIKTIRDDSIPGVSQTEYTFQRTYVVPFSGGATPGSITLSDPLERFQGSGDLTDLEKDTYYHAVVLSANTGANATTEVIGDVFRFDNAELRKINVAVVSEGSTQTISFDVADTTFIGTLAITVTINAKQQLEKTKGLSGYQLAKLGSGSSGGLNTSIGGSDTLGASDIYEIYGVYNLGSHAPSDISISSTTGVIGWGSYSGAKTNIQSRYTLDNGQRAEKYDHGAIVLNGTAPTDTNYMIVVYKNFSHGGGTGKGFLSIDSYNSIGYANIPTFTDPSSGVTYNLRDCIDFRPRRADIDTGTLNYTTITTKSVAATTTAVTTEQIPTPTGNVVASYQYYLGRIDKIIATADKSFTIKKGIASLYPRPPVDESNGMTIYAVIIPPYTANVRDISVKYFDNRRYTMRDIGRLEKRISNLEYYTQLSLLEKQAKDTSIPDATNTQKFKNGFATDPFTTADIFAANTWATRRWGWWNAWFNGSNTWNISSQNYNSNSLADASNSDFNAAIDPLNQELRAPFTVEFDYFDVGTLTNTERNGDLVTLSYTEATAINQPLASTFVNINPFNVIRFIGNITLEPAFDTWIDTQYLPDINLVVDSVVPGVMEQNDRIDNNATRFHSEAGGHPWHVASQTVTFGTNVLGTSTANLGTSIVDVQMVPYIRASKVLGIGNLFKPKARLWPFVENTPIWDYVKPLTVIEITSATGAFNDKQGVYETITFHTGSASGTTKTVSGATGAAAVTAKAAIWSQASTTDPTKHYLTISGETASVAGYNTYGASGATGTWVYAVGSSSLTSGLITDVKTYTAGVGATGATNALVPDEFGNLGFEFNIPANTFKTGERTIRLIDNVDNNVQVEESIGEAKYTAIGQIQTKQNTILTTRLLQNTKTTTQVGYYDPLAQSFVIDSTDYPLGLHVSSVDVYFKSKSATVPVEMQIRNNVNGYPESVPTIPFSSVQLKASDVSASADGGTPTNFKFDNPIHLAPGDYSIVLLSNTQEYNVFVANVGDIIPSTYAVNPGSKIDKQPYIGSLFKSQNASTWEPDQNKDLKFKLNRAVFTSSTGYAEFNIQDPDALRNYHTLQTSVSSILPTGTSIKWYAKTYYGGSTFDTSWVPFNMNQDINYDTLRALDLASGVGSNTLRLRAEMSIDPAIATKYEVSPAIDAASLAVVTAINNINNDASGEANISIGGTATAKYISKVINLASGFEASNINVTVDINKPSGTDVKVYYRSLPTEKTTPITNENWKLMELENSVTNSTSSFDFKEHRYFPAGSFNAYGVPNDNPISSRFNAFQIKIVLLSASKVNTPRLRDLRVIALDT